MGIVSREAGRKLGTGWAGSQEALTDLTEPPPSVPPVHSRHEEHPMDPSQPAGSRRRTTAIIAAAGLACLAIAVPVSGAFGAADNNDAATPSQQQGGQGYGPQGYGQPPAPNGQSGQPRGQDMPNGKCPKHRGSGQGQSQGSGSSDSSGTTLPGDSVAS